MSGAPDLALQKAMVAALKAGVGGVANRVYDAPPQGCAFPYITLSDFQVLDDGADCVDGVEVFANVHIWSRAPGRVETAQLAGAVRDALHDEALTLDSPFALVSLMHQTTRYLEDPDGKTTHGICTFKALIEG